LRDWRHVKGMQARMCPVNSPGRQSPG
jgi:hypothetical protein